MTKKIRLVIAGNEYYINTEENESYIRDLAAELDARITAMSNKNPHLSTTMTAVLLALEYSDANHQLSNEIAELNSALQHATEDTACATVEANEALREIERLNRENLRLRELLTEK